VVTRESPKELTITVANNEVTVGPTATVQKADIEGSNGVVHIINEVLDVPDDIVDKAKQTAELSTLVAAVEKAGLIDFLKAKGPFTVFAPTNDAFNTKFPGGLDGLTPEQVAKVLKYHVIKGRFLSGDFVNETVVETEETPRKLTITPTGSDVLVGRNGANVTTPDIQPWNGVVHIVDKVLVVDDIFELAEATTDLSHFAAAVVHADLVTALQGEGPFTVFLPYDQAFESKFPGPPAGNVSDIDGETVASILKAHVIRGAVLEEDFEDMAVVPTLNDQAPLRFRQDGSGFLIGQDGLSSFPMGYSRVLPERANIPAWNGIVHVFQFVLACRSSTDAWPCDEGLSLAMV